MINAMVLGKINPELFIRAEKVKSRSEYKNHDSVSMLLLSERISKRTGKAIFNSSIDYLYYVRKGYKRKMDTIDGVSYILDEKII